MPYFEYEGDIDVDVDDFLNACNSSEIKELIKALAEDGHLPQSVLNTISSSGAGVGESEFETALDNLRGKWNRLTTEEEEIIVKISKRVS